MEKAGEVPQVVFHKQVAHAGVGIGVEAALIIKVLG